MRNVGRCFGWVCRLLRRLLELDRFDLCDHFGVTRKYLADADPRHLEALMNAQTQTYCWQEWCIICNYRAMGAPADHESRLDQYKVRDGGAVHFE
jgi:hypothetical protein